MKQWKMKIVGDDLLAINMVNGEDLRRIFNIPANEELDTQAIFVDLSSSFQELGTAVERIQTASQQLGCKLLRTASGEEWMGSSLVFEEDVDEDNK